MPATLTLEGSGGRRLLSLIAGAGMLVASFMTIQHFFNANFPESIFKGSFCDISSFFNCESSAYSSISHFRGVPLGFFGLMAGALVFLGALFPSRGFERTNKFISLLNILGVVGLFIYSVFFLKSLCLLCFGYYLFSFFNFFLFWIYGLAGQGATDVAKRLRSFFAPSVKLMIVFALVSAAGAYGFHLFYEAKTDAQSGGVAARVVKEYYSLDRISNPSFISPFWTAKSTERFEDAPIRIIEYADFLCPDCLYLYEQLERLKKEYPGKVNIAFQFFPLDAKCNTVVDKDKHPGACELSYIAAYNPVQFNQIHDTIFKNFQEAKRPEWRMALARKYGVEMALTDPATRDLVQRIINTGAEYEKTSGQYAHGIRSTPTLIINNRMVIGTLPYAHLKAIFESLLSEGEKGSNRRFMENWVDLR